ncbi:MAG: heme ABC transporter permease [Pseudomonadales bacterium]|nr:heme ABC transporter permease [Pseudomonadales bacterium]
MKEYYHKFGSPKYFYELTSKILPWVAVPAALCLLVGTVWGLGFAPADYQQGNSFRIIYIHVPAASLAMSVYVIMAVAGAIGLIWKMKMADMVAKSAAPIGAAFTFLALVTGAIWGKPTWGTWWVWDARLTSMLVMLFLYMGIISLQASFESATAAAKASAVLAIVGLVNLHIIKYSVNWWNTLHQPATFTITDKPSMPPEMFIPLIVMIIGYYLFFATLLMMVTRCEILERESRSRWVGQVLLTQSLKTQSLKTK